MYIYYLYLYLYLHLYLYLYAKCCVRPRRSQALASPSFRPMLPALGKPQLQPHAEGAAPSAAGAAPPLVLIEFPCLAVYTNKVRPRRLRRRCAINPVRANRCPSRARTRARTHARALQMIECLNEIRQFAVLSLRKWGRSVPLPCVLRL